MESTEQTVLDNKRLQRVITDYQRMSVVYGVSIISLSLVITAMVWSAPSFNLFYKTQSIVMPDTFTATPVTMPARSFVATTTRARY